MVLLTLAVVVGLAVVRSAVNGNASLLKFITNKRKREEESRLRAEIQEYEDRMAALRNKAAVARQTVVDFWKPAVDAKTAAVDAIRAERAALEESLELHEKATDTAVHVVRITLAVAIEKLKCSLTIVRRREDEADQACRRASESFEAHKARVDNQARLDVAELIGEQAGVITED